MINYSLEERLEWLDSNLVCEVEGELLLEEKSKGGVALFCPRFISVRGFIL